MKVTRNEYPREWPKISKRKIAEAGNRCKECGIENNAIVRKRGGKLQRVSEEEYIELQQLYYDNQEFVRQKQLEQRLQAERQFLTEDRLLDFALREQFAKIGFKVIQDPDEIFGVYADGVYVPNTDVDEERFFSPESEYTLELRALKAIGLSRIVLQTNHKDGNKSNCEDSNLEVLCQFCHGPKPPYRQRPKRRSR